ncbi:hypothetical protein CBR_g378 [Chara braunii]|uniref:CCHC-type domain-containing protein n=1 Tax=Chara braunii TaxID=69332 RepID=A0A388JQJ3_CHABU|nr:hypothetical protein CBR_g378 [Chara braunii]|eukprot:GBG60047.1 hypothetical protein CBR_g378 [Chara braunii]
MFLTNGPRGSGGGGYNNVPNGQPYGNSNSGNGFGSGGGGVGRGNNACYNCRKTGHFARDCWSRRGRGYGSQQGDPELEEMKEHFRQLRREKQELEVKRELGEERKVREEDEIRRNQDFARKAEEFKLQFRAELLEEWRRTNTEAKEAVVKTRRSVTGRIKRKGSPYLKKKKNVDVWSDETESEETSDRDTSDSTTIGSDSEGPELRKKPHGKRRVKRLKSKLKSRKGKCRNVLGRTPPRVHGRGEWSKQQLMGHVDDPEKEATKNDGLDEPRVPLTGGFKGLSARCSQKGLI